VARIKNTHVPLLPIARACLAKHPERSAAAALVWRRLAWRGKSVRWHRGQRPCPHPHRPKTRPASGLSGIARTNQRQYGIVFEPARGARVALVAFVFPCLLPCLTFLFPPPA
jgi:hypothetical protein